MQSAQYSDREPSWIFTKMFFLTLQNTSKNGCEGSFSTVSSVQVLQCLENITLRKNQSDWLILGIAYKLTLSLDNAVRYGLGAFCPSINGPRPPNPMQYCSLRFSIYFSEERSVAIRQNHRF